MTHNFDIVILTDDRYVTPSNRDEQYIRNLLLEDQLVQKSLENRGFRVDRKSWSDPTFNWATTKAVLFRTTWDYFERYSEWTTWLKNTSSVTRMINPYELVKWNMDKHYLGDLFRKGINIPETHFIEVGEQNTLTELIARKDWQKAILKPCFSGAARHTYKIEEKISDDLENTFQELIAREAMMLQPFQENVVKQGEVSLMVMGGRFTHAVLKVAKPGDFRVQDDFGGTVHKYTPTSEEITFAEKTVAACDPFPNYARVDIIKDNNNKLALIELELIEPELWFRMNPEAADMLAENLVL